MRLSPFCLWFLILLLDLIVHCGDVNAAKIGSSQKSSGPQKVVAASARVYPIDSSSGEAFEGHFGPTSLTRYTVPQGPRHRDPSWTGPWKCATCHKTNGKKAAFCDRCGDTWENGAPHAAQKQESMESTDQSWTYRPWQDWRKSSQYRADSVSSTHSSVSSHRGQPAASGKNKQKQNRRRGQPKASQGRSKGKKGNGKGDGGKAPPVPPPPETPSWPTLDNASFPALAALPASTSTTAPNVNLQLAAENRMLVQLLRDAYPVAQDRPPDAKAAIDKSEQELNKHVTKSIHSATKSLDKAQRLLTETTEARRRHRSSWIAHLTESIKTWETQLEAFRKHSAALQDLAQKPDPTLQPPDRTFRD